MARMGHDSPRAALMYQHTNQEADHGIADAIDRAVKAALRKPRQAQAEAGRRERRFDGLFSVHDRVSITPKLIVGRRRSFHALFLYLNLLPRSVGTRVVDLVNRTHQPRSHSATPDATCEPDEPSQDHDETADNDQ